MFGHNVFAVLTPMDPNAVTAFDLPHNVKRFRQGVGSVAKEPTINSREPTPGAVDPLATEEEVAVIILTLDEEVKDPENMWQFGTRPSTSDVLLGHRGTKRVSARQCNLTIDDTKHWIWLHDFHSTYGTAVGYNDQKKDEVRTKDTWILSYGPGPEGGTDLGEITIHVGKLAYKIEFPNHGAAHPEYIKNLQAFIKKCKDAAPPLEGLGLDSDPPTQKPSQAHTPSADPIYLPKEVIGKGAFGEVRRVIKLRDGNSYAAKYFFPPKSEGHKKNHKKRKQDEVGETDVAYMTWLERIRREFTIMQNNPHVSTLCLRLLRS